MSGLLKDRSIRYHTTMRAISHNISDDYHALGKMSILLLSHRLNLLVWHLNVHVENGIRIISHTRTVLRRIPYANDYVNTSPVCLFLCALLYLCTHTHRRPNHDETAQACLLLQNIYWTSNKHCLCTHTNTTHTVTSTSHKQANITPLHNECLSGI